MHISSPFVTYEQFSKLSGIAVNTIRTMVSEGRLPIRPKTRVKEKPLINMVALTNEANRYFD